MTQEAKEVVYTGEIPQCPVCEKPTIRIPMGQSKTLLYYQPSYDENGVNTNPDRNRVTKSFLCKNCDRDYCIQGNDHDGYKYILLRA